MVQKKGALDRYSNAESSFAENQTPKTTLFYYTSTGNSLWIARALARELGNAEVVSIIDWDKKPPVTESQLIGLIFPVHIWGVPKRVLEFLNHLSAIQAEYIFAVANHGGQVSNTLVQLKQVMQSKGLRLSSGWEVAMPSNYIPWGGPVPPAKQKKLFAAALTKISYMAPQINSRVETPMEKGPLWQRIVFTWIYKISFPHIPEMAKNFWVDDRCNQCGLCVKLCPSKNIMLHNDKLTWQNHCEQCLACVQWCPQEALQYGKKTPAYERYHHPEIKLQDLLR